MCIIIAVGYVIMINGLLFGKAHTMHLTTLPVATLWTRKRFLMLKLFLLFGHFFNGRAKVDKVRNTPRLGKLSHVLCALECSTDLHLALFSYVIASLRSIKCRFWGI